MRSADYGSKPIAAIRYPPAYEHYGYGRQQCPPERQQKVRKHSEKDEGSPEDLPLHLFIVVPQLSFAAQSVYKSAMKRSLKEIASYTGARLLGEDAQVSAIGSLRSAKPGDLIFVEDEKDLAAALSSKATAVITGDLITETSASKPRLVAQQPRLAFARAAELLCCKNSVLPGVHPSAVIRSSAKLGVGVSIGAHVIIDEDTTIGENSCLAAGAVIGRDVQIGHDCRIYPNVTIYPGTRLGNRVVIHAGAVLGSDGFGYVRDQETQKYFKFPQIGRLEIEDDVEIGANSTVDRGALEVTHIGRGSKIDNLVHIGHNVQIGEDVVIAAQTGISGSAVIENHAVIAGQVGIADYVRIQEGVIVGAQSGIPSRKVIRGKGVVFWGTPARPIRNYLKELAVLARLAKKR
jgi:UDP-3-O-[3-hydroxymyristoyl] glucosamine N-acyltransferase